MKKILCLLILTQVLTACCIPLADDGDDDDDYVVAYHAAVVVDAALLDQVSSPSYVAIDGEPWDRYSAQHLISGDSTYCSFSSSRPLHNGESIHFENAYGGSSYDAAHNVTMTGYVEDDPGTSVSLYCARSYSSIDDGDVSSGMSNILEFAGQ